MLFWVECNDCGLFYETSINRHIYCPHCGSHDFRFFDYNEVSE